MILLFLDGQTSVSVSMTFSREQYGETLHCRVYNSLNDLGKGEDNVKLNVTCECCHHLC